jgi:hypothetical protein
VDVFLGCRTEDRAAGWIRLTREILKLPEAPSVKDKEKHSKARRPQPLIKLVLRRYNSLEFSYLFPFFLNIGPYLSYLPLMSSWKVLFASKCTHNKMLTLAL